MVSTPPPAITPKQMNILRAVTAMAWSDGVLEPAEVELMATRLAKRFAANPAQQASLAQEIRQYFDQQIPLDEILPKITEDADRRLILKLGYLVIAASARSPEEPAVNVLEQQAFTELVQNLNLATATVHEVSEEAKAELGNPEVEPMEALISGFSSHYGC